MEGMVWAAVTQGLRSILATDEHGLERAFLLVEPSSYYFRVMTRAEWMPVLIGERF
jgi:hypothetical protein